MRFLNARACTDTHISTFTLPLDFDPPPSLCISYELSEKTQWIEWQRSKARPSNRPGWSRDGWLCVYECVCAYMCLWCVWLTLSTVRTVYASKYEHVFTSVCPSRVLFLPNQGPFFVFHNLNFPHIRNPTHPHTHRNTLLHSSPLWSVVRGVMWQVFNQRWPGHAVEMICWTRLNPLPFQLIHPLNWTRVSHTSDPVSWQLDRLSRRRGRKKMEG